MNIPIPGRGTRPTVARVEADPAFAGLISGSEGIEKILLTAAKPISTLPQLRDLIDSSGFLRLERKLLMANRFGQSVTVFMACQVVAALIGVAMALIALTGVIVPFGFALLAVGITAYPYNILSKAATAREIAVTKHLPVFADQLQMPLETGLPILGALQFVAQRSPGPVSDEIHNLLAIHRTGTVPDAELFLASGYRLGTPDALAFMTTLLQAYTAGSSVTEQLAATARQLRHRDFQRRLAEVKKFPVKLVGAMFAHLVPLLFIIILVPSMLLILSGF